MNNAEYMAMHRSYEEARSLMERLQYWRLTAETRKMLNEAYDLREASDYHGAVAMFERVRDQGEAFVEGYEIPSIRLAGQQSNGSKVELFAQPRPIKDEHYLHKDQEIVHCTGKTFRIVDCNILTQEEDLIRCVSGDVLIYQGILAPEAEQWDTVEAPWNNLDLVKVRKFSAYKPFLGVSPRWVTDENAYSHGL